MNCCRFNVLCARFCPAREFLDYVFKYGSLCLRLVRRYGSARHHIIMSTKAKKWEPERRPPFGLGFAFPSVRFRTYRRGSGTWCTDEPVSAASKNFQSNGSQVAYQTLARAALPCPSPFTHRHQLSCLISCCSINLVFVMMHPPYIPKEIDALTFLCLFDADTPEDAFSAFCKRSLVLVFLSIKNDSLQWLRQLQTYYCTRVRKF